MSESVDLSTRIYSRHSCALLAVQIEHRRERNPAGSDSSLKDAHQEAQDHNTSEVLYFCQRVLDVLKASATNLCRRAQDDHDTPEEDADTSKEPDREATKQVRCRRLCNEVSKIED